MRITADFTQLHSGENLSRRLKFFVDEEFYGKKAKLGFITPMGNIYFTQELPFTQGQGEFILPSALLDGRGQLICQLFCWDETGYLGKSPMTEFTVYPSVDDRDSPVISEENKKSLALLFEYLEEKADVLHTHDGRYFTRDEIIRLLAEKSDISHTHNDLYYTESETDALLSEKCDNAHTHDGRYYTKESIDSMLAGDFSEEHTHDDRYYTEAELDGLLAGKSDTGHTHPHNHDAEYAPLAGYNSVTALQNTHGEIIGQLAQSVSSIADFVVEEGTSGDWSYRKWASGVAECWAKFGFWGERVSNTTIKKVNYNMSFPFVFSRAPTVFATACSIPSEVEFSVVSAVGTPTHLQTVALLGYTPVETRISEGFISVYATGRWQ